MGKSPQKMAEQKGKKAARPRAAAFAVRSMGIDQDSACNGLRRKIVAAKTMANGATN